NGLAGRTRLESDRRIFRSVRPHAVVRGRRPGAAVAALRRGLDDQPHLRRAVEAVAAVARFSFLGRSMLALLLVLGAAIAAAAAELTFDLKVERGRVAETMRLIRVKQGDVVRLRWASDQPLVVHLHGYDVEKRIAPGSAVEMTFTAYARGRFPVHLHAQGAGGRAHEEAPLVNVEFYPR